MPRKQKQNQWGYPQLDTNKHISIYNEYAYLNKIILKNNLQMLPVSAGHRDKRVGVSAGSILIQFDSEGVLSVRKPRFFLVKRALGGIIDFSSTEQTPW